MRFKFKYEKKWIEIEIDHRDPSYVAVANNLDCTQKRSYLNAALDGILETIATAARFGLIDEKNLAIWQKTIVESISSVKRYKKSLGLYDKDGVY